MSSLKILKESLLLLILLILTLSSETEGSPYFPDIRESQEIGSDGGSIMAEDTETGITVGIYIPENAVRENTRITMVIHGTRQAGVLGKTHINGISLLPDGLIFLDKVRMELYNPPIDVTKGMILYHVVNNQFIIPLGSQVLHPDEGYIEGTLYITGKFSLGTPSTSEISNQSNKLATYNPSRPLADKEEESVKRISLVAQTTEPFGYSSFKGPFMQITDTDMPAFKCPSVANDDCLRWQKVLTQVEGHVTWMHLRRLSGLDQSASASAEQANAERALKHGMENYLSKQSGANRCGGYLKAAEKYIETARNLGMNTEALSFIDQRYNQLINECSFEFAVETHEWINHPRETQSDGATFEEKSNWYGNIRCIIPPSEFGGPQPRIATGEGTMSLYYEKHWIGDEKEDHIETNGSWKARKIQGSFRYKTTDSGSKYPEDVSMTIYWDKNVTTRLWGKPGKEDKPYDWKNTDTDPIEENKSYLLKHGYEDKIGTSEAGRSIKVFLLRNPFNMKDDPNDCF